MDLLTFVVELIRLSWQSSLTADGLNKLNGGHPLNAGRRKTPTRLRWLRPGRANESQYA
jgi:hypothetical protein